MHEPFLIGESIRFGWNKTRAHSGLIFKILLTLFGVQVAQSIVQEVLMPSFEGFIAMAVLIVANVVIGAGTLVVTLNIARGERATYAQLVPPAALVARYFFASLLAGVVVVIGFILLIIPGIYFLLRYSMVRFVAIDGEGIVDSLRKSSILTKGIKGKLALFMLALLGLNILGFLAFFVGLLVTLPTSMIAYAHVYQKLLTRVERAHAK